MADDAVVQMSLPLVTDSCDNSYAERSHKKPEGDLLAHVCIYSTQWTLMPGVHVVLVPGGEGLQPKHSAPSCPLSSLAQHWQCWEDKGSWLDPESMRVATIQLDPTTSSRRRGGANLGGVSREAEIVAPGAG